jgi:hypothetical protein
MNIDPAASERIMLFLFTLISKIYGGSQMRTPRTPFAKASLLQYHKFFKKNVNVKKPLYAAVMLYIHRKIR